MIQWILLRKVKRPCRPLFDTLDTSGENLPSTCTRKNPDMTGRIWQETLAQAVASILILFSGFPVGRFIRIPEPDRGSGVSSSFISNGRAYYGSRNPSSWATDTVHRASDIGAPLRVEKTGSYLKLQSTGNQTAGGKASVCRENTPPCLFVTIDIKNVTAKHFL